MSNIMTSRSSGILLHPTSFPGPYGIGDLGDNAYEFVDFLERSGQKLWQILPLGPTGYGDSPYQAFSSFAGQPLLISPDKLAQIDLLSNDDLTTYDGPENQVDYGYIFHSKHQLLQKAFSNFQLNPEEALKNEFEQFCKEEDYWLTDYALFMASHDYHDYAHWNQWPHNIAFPSNESKIEWINKLKNEFSYYQFIQFIFYKQWMTLKAYANSKGIHIIGDIPIFVAYSSSDVWADSHLFYLDKEGFPTIVAGVPPDYFSETGQLWGNPLYDWDKHKSEDYNWWIRRITHSLRFVDILRIDHFRGFEEYWAVPYGSETAINGEWLKGPSKDFFYALQKELGDRIPIIAEDLGIITESVEELRDYFKFPGMSVLQFGYEDPNSNNIHLPHTYNANKVCYSGTHDNDTSLGWYEKASEENKDRARRYMSCNGEDISWDFIRTCFNSPANFAVIPLQDVLSLDSDARMNTPGIAQGNWGFRYTKDMLSDSIAERLLQLTKESNREI